VTGSGVGFRLIPTVPNDVEVSGDTDGLVIGVEVARVWIAVEHVEDGKLMSAGGGGGGIMVRFTLGLEGRCVTFAFEREEFELVERKRPSSSSTRVAGTMDRVLFTDDFGTCEPRPGRVLIGEDERPNMSAGSIGWGSRSESPSMSESGGTRDFLRRGDGVSACELYLLRKGRDEGIGEGVREE
jgi:hypothetical protein